MEKKGLICGAHVDHVSLELCDLMRRISNRCMMSLCSRTSLLVIKGAVRRPPLNSTHCSFKADQISERVTEENAQQGGKVKLVSVPVYTWRWNLVSVWIQTLLMFIDLIGVSSSVLWSVNYQRREHQQTWSTRDVTWSVCSVKQLIQSQFLPSAVNGLKVWRNSVCYFLNSQLEAWSSTKQRRDF